jgi:phosphatidylinositol alpha-1,6-mannosyltransferase
MKNILIITIDFPPNYGGVANYLSSIALNLPSNKVTVLTSKTDVNNFDQSQPYKIYRKNLIFKYPFLWPKWLPSIYHLWQIIKKEKIELVLVGQILPLGIVAFIIKKILKIPYAISCHGMDILIPQKNFRKKIFLKKILQNADFIIANSQFTKNEIIKLNINDQKIIIIYPCPTIFEREDFKDKDIEELKKNIVKKYDLKNKKILLTVGRLVERKGHEIVIKALPKFIEKIPNIIYLIVGDGPQREKLKFITNKFNLQEKVIFTGEVSKKELMVFYALCDIFIMLPFTIEGDVEGFGTVFLEANKFGKPVIASCSGGIGEAVINNFTGITVDYKNVDEVVGSVIKLLTNQNLAKKLGEQGRKRVEKEFTWQKQIEKIKKFL